MTSSRIAPRFRVAAIAGVAAFLLAVSAGGAWAYWTAQATASGSAVTSTIGVTQAGFDNPATTVYTPNALSSTLVYTITNTSAIAGTATSTITSSGAYATKFTVQAWQVASAAGCTASTAVPATGVATGTWGAVGGDISLAAGATGYVCVRATLPDWTTATDPSGGQSFAPVLAVSLSASGWVATAPSATNGQSTAGMYPLVTTLFPPGLASNWFTVRNPANTALCMDDSGSGGVGSLVLTYSCHNGANQRWQFTPVSGSQSLVTIRTRAQPTLRVSTSSGGAVNLQNSVTGSTAQQWYVQQLPTAGRYQLVSALTGKCFPLVGTSSDTGMTTVECNAPSAQLLFQREALTLAATGSGAARDLSWGNTIAGQPMTIARKNDSGVWVAFDSIAAGDTVESITPVAGTYTYRIVFGTSATGTDIAFGEFSITRSGSTVTGGAGLG